MRLLVCWSLAKRSWRWETMPAMARSETSYQDNQRFHLPSRGSLNAKVSGVPITRLQFARTVIEWTSGSLMQVMNSITGMSVAWLMHLVKAKETTNVQGCWRAIQETEDALKSLSFTCEDGMCMLLRLLIDNSSPLALANESLLASVLGQGSVTCCPWTGEKPALVRPICYCSITCYGLCRVMLCLVLTNFL